MFNWHYKHFCETMLNNMKHKNHLLSSIFRTRPPASWPPRHRRCLPWCSRCPDVEWKKWCFYWPNNCWTEVKCIFNIVFVNYSQEKHRKRHRKLTPFCSKKKGNTSATNFSELRPRCMRNRSSHGAGPQDIPMVFPSMFHMKFHMKLPWPLGPWYTQNLMISTIIVSHEFRFKSHYPLVMSK